MAALSDWAPDSVSDGDSSAVTAGREDASVASEGASSPLSSHPSPSHRGEVPNTRARYHRHVTSVSQLDDNGGVSGTTAAPALGVLDETAVVRMRESPLRSKLLAPSSGSGSSSPTKANRRLLRTPATSDSPLDMRVRGTECGQGLKQ